MKGKRIKLKGEALREFMLSKVDPTANYDIYSTHPFSPPLSKQKPRRDCTVRGKKLKVILGDAYSDDFLACDCGQGGYRFYFCDWIYVSRAK